MNEYQLGGSLSLITALGKTNAFAEFLEPHGSAIETEDPCRTHLSPGPTRRLPFLSWRYYKSWLRTPGTDGSRSLEYRQSTGETFIP
jgi:hypothetical protein